jgi:phenol 2-monooxygenase
MHMAAFYNPSPDGGIVKSSRAADVTTASPARYPFEVTLHQGAIENIFLDAMKKMDLDVERPVVPLDIELSENRAELDDPQAYPVKVRAHPGVQYD